MIRSLRLFEHVVVVALAFLMVVTIAFSTFELAVTIAQDLWQQPRFLLEIEDLLGIFGLFLLVLLGIELLETMKAYLVEDVVHVEVVMIVAIIAIARKVIILDLKSVDGARLVGLASVLLALALGYRLLRQSTSPSTPGTGVGPAEPAKGRER